MKKLIAIGETKFIEFKKEYTKTLLKTISAFANYHNGNILIGVNDDGSVIGIENPDAVRLSIENAINDNIFPKPYYEIEYDEIEEETIISIKVYKGENTPYTLNNKTYKRMDTSTVQVDKWGYEDLVLKGRNLSFDSLNCSYENLSVDYLERKLREKLGIGKLSEDMLKSLELIKNDKYTNAMALLSDKNPLVNSTLALIRFDGDSILNIKDRLILSKISIIEQFDRSMDFYIKHINTQEIINNAYRKTIEEIPRVAFREAIANAIVHRDYSKQGDIKVEIYDSRIEIISPGGLPIGISEDEFLEGRISIPRNKILSDIFLRINIIERLATGIRRIKEYYKEYDANPVFDISENTIKIVLPNIACKNKDTYSMNSLKGKIKDLGNNEKILAEYLIENKTINRVEAEQVLNLKKTQTVEILKKLQSTGIVVKIGSGKETKYTLNE